MKEKIQQLAQQRRNAKTAEEKASVERQMEALQNEDPQTFAESIEELIKTTVRDVERLTVAERLGEVPRIVSMSYIATTYFGKSRSWLAHKLNENTVNGKPVQFTPEELDTLRYALRDIAAKLSALSASI